ncbi:MAG: helix-turn-helix domain-containing protein [Oscillospiraceae bacterium]
MESNVTVHRVVRDKKKPGQYIEPHSHSFFHYLFNLAGHVKMHADDADFVVPPGGLAMIPPRVKHSIHSLDYSCSLNIKFTCEGPLEKPVAQFPFFLPRIGDYQQVLLKNLLEEAVLQQPGSAELVSLRMYEFLLLLNRTECAAPLAPSFDVGRNSKLKKALELIAIQPNLSVAELAAACGYHENYFSSFFKKAMGCTPRHYINLQKINKAKDLLLFSDCNVTETADQLGFSGVHYFSRVFHQLTGITPSEYLNRGSQPVTVNVIHNSYTPCGIFEFPLRDPTPAG